MKINNEINNNLENNLKNNINNNIEIKQDNFLELNLGKIINTAVDYGLKFILPDLFEDQIINIKNTILKDGLGDGINNTIKKGIEFGKNVLNNFKVKFENINQVEKVLNNSEIINNVSEIINKTINNAQKNGKISKENANLILEGKNIILDNIDANVENMIFDQSKIENQLTKAIKNWNNYYKKENFEKMEKEYSIIKENLDKLMPIEKIINESRKIENLHMLIKNNGQNFNLSEDELKLIEMF